MPEISMNEVRTAWQSQSTAPRILSRKELSKRSRELETGSHVRMGLFYCLSVAFVGLGLIDSELWAAFVKVAVAFILALVFEKAYGLRYKHAWTTLDLQVESVQFYRDELLRRRDFMRSRRRVVLPLLFLLAESLKFIWVSVGSVSVISFVPVVAVLAGWLAFSYRRKRLELPIIEREIGALSRLSTREVWD
jgi:hypothetical protein